MQHYRQGDVLAERIESIPQDAKKQEGTRIVLAEGETTGHMHAIESETATSFIGQDGTLYLQLDEPATVTHQEHADIKLPTGTYRIVHQREYSPGEIRRVQD